MGMFKKKVDPISEKERELQRQIAAIEQEIQRLHRSNASRQKNGSATNVKPPACQEAVPSFSKKTPRLRSTTHPAGTAPHAVQEADPEPARRDATEPVFEEVRNPFRTAASSDREQDQAMGIRQNDFGASWARLRNHFKSPVTSNPKLVNYLAAGSIQGLRPLRYEKRVARNRFIALVGILALILWGILALLMKR